MKLLQEKLGFLLDKYSVEATSVLKDDKTAIIDGKEIPLLSHRFERRFIELKNIVQGGTLVGVSVMRVARTVEKDANLFEELYRELDICQYILGKAIKSVMSMENGNVLNTIATTEDGVVCTLEISATLKRGEPAKDKHEIISQRGIACDVVVDAQLKQNSIYLFGNENQTYTDVDFELYGLSVEEIAIVRSAFAIAKNNTAEEMLTLDRTLQTLIKKVKQALKTGERQVI
jgi:hypothetical protein